MRYLTLRESIALALDRKRRLRLIHKWRHGWMTLPRNRDRFKLMALRHPPNLWLDM